MHDVVAKTPQQKELDRQKQVFFSSEYFSLLLRELWNRLKGASSVKTFGSGFFFCWDGDLVFCLRFGKDYAARYGSDGLQKGQCSKACFLSKEKRWNKAMVTPNNQLSFFPYQGLAHPANLSAKFSRGNLYPANFYAKLWLGCEQGAKNGSKNTISRCSWHNEFCLSLVFRWK